MAKKTDAKDDKKGGYDASLDVTVVELGRKRFGSEEKGTELSVTMQQYNGGVAKLALTRTLYPSKRAMPAGRLTPEETLALITIFRKLDDETLEALKDLAKCDGSSSKKKPASKAESLAKNNERVEQKQRLKKLLRDGKRKLAVREFGESFVVSFEQKARMKALRAEADRD